MFNSRVHREATGDKYTIKAIDIAVWANSTELRDKILKQIPSDPRKTKQFVSNLQLAEGERTEVAINIRTDDDRTNGAGNVIKKVKIHNRNTLLNIVQSNSVMPFKYYSTQSTSFNKRKRLEISNWFIITSFNQMFTINIHMLHFM